jgi:hypothetical protein
MIIGQSKQQVSEPHLGFCNQAITRFEELADPSLGVKECDRDRLPLGCAVDNRSSMADAADFLRTFLLACNNRLFDDGFEREAKSAPNLDPVDPPPGRVSPSKMNFPLDVEFRPR